MQVSVTNSTYFNRAFEREKEKERKKNPFHAFSNSIFRAKSIKEIILYPPPNPQVCPCLTLDYSKGRM